MLNVLFVKETGHDGECLKEGMLDCAGRAVGEWGSSEMSAFSLPSFHQCRYAYGAYGQKGLKRVWSEMHQRIFYGGESKLMKQGTQDA